MAKALTQTIQNMITVKDIQGTYIFEINDVVFTSSVISYNISYDKDFGSASATFTLDNNASAFGSGGASEIKIGDKIELIEDYTGDSTNWKSFYGEVVQRTINKNSSNRTITITCLDYINKLKNYDIDLEVEGTKVEVTNEVLTPNYLASPNEDLAQLYDFVNDAIATNPMPVIMIEDTYNSTEDPQFDGFEVYYPTGQLKLGTPLNAKNNYNVKVRSYYYYTHGVYGEDILEEILTQVDGYGNYLFGETSAQDVIDNHLTTTYEAEEGTGETDTLTPNTSTSTITIETTLASSVSAGATSVVLTSGSGFPTSGSGTINGDTFTWTGKSTNTLTGVPATGGNALKAHNSGDYAEYESTYVAGKVWSLTYSNLVTTLVSGNFTVPGATIDYVDKRYGRIILDTAISLLATVTCDINYSLKTLQATGIELNGIKFKPRELDNAFDAIEKLRKYLAPNYIIRTQGDDKIWASYLTQKTIADYTLNLMQKIDYMDDEDIYTRVSFYGKNADPTDLMFGDDVDFVTTGENYKALASQNTLTFDSEEGNYYVYKSSLGSAGYIDLEDIKPIVYINNVAIDNKSHQMVALPVVVEVNNRSETRSGCHGTSKENYTKITQYYWYNIYFSHMNIEPTEPIYIYNSTGSLIVTISANDGNMDYANGIWRAPGDQRNSTLESISTATYTVFYSDESLVIDYNNVLFKIAKSIIPDRTKASVSATYEYWYIMTPVENIASIVDGRWDTQVQTEFFAEPTTGYNYAIIDLGATKNIQTIDLVAGFFKPDTIRKYDVDIRFTLHSSTDNITYTAISDATHNVKLTGGEAATFSEEDLGTSFTARYIKIILESVKKIDFRDGVWPVAFTEIAAYDNIIVNSQATLIVTNELNGALSGGESTVTVLDTTGFDSSGTAYLNAGGTSGNTDDAFTYTGKTSTTFTGCSGVQAQSDDATVAQTLETDTTLYDHLYLLPSLGDRLYKDVRISDETLYTQTQLDDLAKDYLREYVKEHTKRQVNVIFSPYLKVGQTVLLTDTYNNANENYFIEAVNNNSGNFSLTLARYPA